MQDQKFGFTLIELLVTVAIIAILSAIGLVVYTGVQTTARDNIRKGDLNNLATALEIYYQENGKYIVKPDGTDITVCADTTFYDTIGPYLSANIVPKDPKTQANYCYISVSVSANIGQGFRLFTLLENPAEANLTGCTGYNFSVVSDNLILACPP